MKTRRTATAAALAMIGLLIGGCGGTAPVAPAAPVTAVSHTHESAPFLYDSHAECAAIQPSGEYCEMHGGHEHYEGVWIEPTQISREEGLLGITVAIVPAGDSVLDQPGNGPDLSGMKGRVLPFAVTLDTHAGDISDLDLNGKVFLVDAAGTEIPGIARQTYESAHHPVWAVAFPKLDSRGGSLEGAAHLRVVIRGVGEIPVRMLQVPLESVRK